MSKPVRIRGFVASRVEELAAAERRSFANTVETLLLDALEAGKAGRGAVLTDRVGSAGVAPDSGTPDVRLRGTAGTAPAPSRSVSADVAAKVPGVMVGVRAHMRGDRPMLECKERVVAGQMCSACGRHV